jgi:hypothetical protein
MGRSKGVQWSGILKETEAEENQEELVGEQSRREL